MTLECGCGCSVLIGNCILTQISVSWGFPGSSTDKKSACNVGDSSSIPGLGRSPGEGIGYPLQYSWASLVVQMVKNLPALRETRVQSLGWEDPLEEGMATHSSILAWRIRMNRGAWRTAVHWVRVGHKWVTQHSTSVTGDIYFKEIVRPYWTLMKVKVTQSCLTVCDPMDYTVHGILQVRILEWVAIPFSRGSFQPRN